MRTHSARMRVRDLLDSATWWALCALFLMAALAQALIVPVLPTLTERYQLSSSGTAVLLVLPAVATLLISVPAGMLGERLGARRLTLWASGLLFVSCAAQAAPSYPVILAGRIGMGLVFGVVWTAGVAWVTSIGSRRAAVAVTVTCASVGSLAGPALGGMLAEVGGVELPFLVAAAAAAVVSAALVAFTWTAGADQECELDESASRPTSAAGLLSVARRPRVVMAGGALVVVGAVTSVGQLLITAGLHADHLSSGLIGIAFTAYSGIYIVVGLVQARLGGRAVTTRINAVMTAMLALSLFPAVLGGSTVLLVSALMLGAVPAAAATTVAYELCSSSDGTGGAAFGLVTTAWAAARVLFPLAAGALTQAAGSGAAYLVTIVSSTAIAAALLYGVGYRAARRAPATGPAPLWSRRGGLRAAAVHGRPRTARARGAEHSLPVWFHDRPDRLSAPHQLEPCGDLFERQPVGDQGLEREPSASIELEDQREVAFGARGPVHAPENPSLHAWD